MPHQGKQRPWLLDAAHPWQQLVRLKLACVCLCTDTGRCGKSGKRAFVQASDALAAAPVSVAPVWQNLLWENWLEVDACGLHGAPDPASAGTPKFTGRPLSPAVPVACCCARPRANEHSYDRLLAGNKPEAGKQGER